MGVVSPLPLVETTADGLQQRGHRYSAGFEEIRSNYGFRMAIDADERPSISDPKPPMKEGLATMS